jgi:hypothetical protein
VFTYLLYRENLESGVENTVESSQTRSLNNFNISSILNCAFVKFYFCFRQEEEEPMEISSETGDNPSRYIYHSSHIHKITIVPVCFV